MAPPPEYDKEPKAPDKSDTNIVSEELLNSLDNDHHPNLDISKPSLVATLEVENNKHVEGLDDGQLRALLDEAITYKNPKDREGKSNLFKELLEEVEVQEEQACEEAARTLSGCRGAGGAAGAGAGRRGGARGRRALPHSSSMQDLVAAALAAEPAPRRHRHAPPSVSARAIHGGSLPSGVDTSSLLCEEPARGGYLATVRCVNPPPLAERRVSASDANAPAEMELLNRKNKPSFPMTYTARATLEIGSGSVSSGRAVTTTTASNQVAHKRRRGAGRRRTASPGEMYDPKTSKIQQNQNKLLNALQPKEMSKDNELFNEKRIDFCRSQSDINQTNYVSSNDKSYAHNLRKVTFENSENCKQWSENIDTWYRGLSTYIDLLNQNFKDDNGNLTKISNVSQIYKAAAAENTYAYNMIPSGDVDDLDLNMNIDPYYFNTQNESHSSISKKNEEHSFSNLDKPEATNGSDRHRKIYIPKHQDLVLPNLSSINPKNIRRMTIGNTEVAVHNTDIHKKIPTPSKMLSQVPLNDIGKIGKQSKMAKGVETNVKLDTNKLTNQSTKKPLIEIELKDFAKVSSEIMDTQAKPNVNIELKHLPGVRPKTSEDPFLCYVNNQYKLLHSIEASASGQKYDEININRKTCGEVVNVASRNNESNSIEADIEPFKDVGETQPEVASLSFNQIALTKTNAIQTNHANYNSEKKRIVLGQPSNDHIFFTLPAYLLKQSNVADLSLALSPYSESNNNEIGPLISKTETKSKKIEKKNQKVPSGNAKNTVSKIEGPRSNGVTVLLIENFFKNYVSGMVKGSPEMSPPDDKKVDSAISFSCITTPEVVNGCSTTASGGQSGASADSKPRSVVATSFNGLPLTRHYGAIAPPPDDAKKSIDENGNSVQGFSSPLSGSSQHKKPRRKKSSKNETVIDCQQIDGYQGDKDVNELLRFIESDAEPARAKLRKHRDDADDKHKKRCERRKDKDGAKGKRAASLEELSRTSLAELTAPAPARAWPAPPPPAPPAPPPPAPPAPLELTDFQTVTKRRRARRRGEETGRSAAPRSADSTEDTDGASPPPAAPAASYADIARARTAIPDLISSCGAAALPAARARRKPPDVLAARPAVVLRAPPDRAELHGVTFGFELNHQLLAPRRADALRYLPPAPPPDPLPLQTLVDYVGAAWEAVVRCGGEVRYFGE